jgi:hypothetical protein
MIMIRHCTTDSQGVLGKVFDEAPQDWESDLESGNAWSIVTTFRDGSKLTRTVVRHTAPTQKVKDLD